MQVSLNEIEKLCEKAARGAGLPAGVDSDTGFAAAWLEARGLPGVATTARDLAASHGDGGLTWHRSDEAERSGDAGGRSLLPYAGSLVDLAAADALREPGIVRSIVLANAGSPLFLIPAAVARCNDGCAFRLTWGLPDVAVTVDDRNRLAIYAQSVDELGSSAILTLRIEAVVGASDFDGPALPLLYGPETLDDQRATSLSQGVAVDEASWNELQKLAKLTLVPASAESRSRGAGAEIDDNE